MSISKGKTYRKVTPVEGRYKHPRTDPFKGVKRVTIKSGSGSTCTFWQATISCNGEVRIARFSVKRLGNATAKLQAVTLRRLWFDELVHKLTRA